MAAKAPANRLRHSSSLPADIAWAPRGPKGRRKGSEATASTAAICIFSPGIVVVDPHSAFRTGPLNLLQFTCDWHVYKGRTHTQGDLTHTQADLHTQRLTHLYTQTDPRIAVVPFCGRASLFLTSITSEAQNWFPFSLFPVSSFNKSLIFALSKHTKYPFCILSVLPRSRRRRRSTTRREIPASHPIRTHN